VAIIECDEDVTETEATKADRGALGLKLVTIGELDAHREESPELIGSEADHNSVLPLCRVITQPSYTEELFGTIE
jgi:hypothetical protein